MDYIPAECAARSVGPSLQVVSLLLQTLTSSFCSQSNDKLLPKNCNVNDKARFDFIIVGSSSSGAVVAGRLSENPNFRVLLIEAGGDPIIEPNILDNAFLMRESDLNWNRMAYAENGCKGSKTKTCDWKSKKMLGGSSSINYMNHISGRKENYDYNDFVDYIKRFENSQNLEIASLLTVFNKNPFSSMLGSEKFSNVNPKLNNLNIQNNFASSQSVAEEYLSSAANRSNLCVVKGAHAYQILFDENKKATGIKFDYNGIRNVTVYANKEVILCSGSVGSAQLLLLSGIGPQNQLEKLKIPTISNLPVGENLFDQVVVYLFFKFTFETNPLLQVLDAEYEYLTRRNGLFSTVNADDFENIVNTTNISQEPDVQVEHFYYNPNSKDFVQLVSNVLNLNTEISEELLNINKQYQIGVILATLLQPKSFGTVTLKSPSYKDHPDINANYFDHPDDIDTMASALEEQVTLEETESFKKNIGEFIRLPICNELEYRSKSYWECYLKHISTTSHRPSGTNKMGSENDPGSVVDSRLFVQGVSSLRVADLSITTKLVSTNTNAAAIAIGEKAANMINKAHS